MNEITAFGALRPVVAGLSESERTEIWERVITYTQEDETIPAAERLIVVRSGGTPRPTRGRGRIAAAVSVAAAGVIGFVAISPRGGTDPPNAAGDASNSASTAPAVPAALPITLMPASFPRDLQLSGGGSSERTAPSMFQRRVFAPLDDQTNHRRLISVEYASSRSGVLPCFNMPAITPAGPPTDAEVDAWLDAATPMDGARSFDVDDTVGYTCATDGPLTAGWESHDVTVDVRVGPEVARDELVGFARGLRWIPAEEPTADGPAFDLDMDQVPSGWQAVVSEDVPFIQQITESTWIAVPGGDGAGPPDLMVKVWTGVDEQGLVALHPPIEAEPVTVRGREGFIFVSSQRGDSGPLEIEIWWQERPGMVVSVVSQDVFDVGELVGFIGTFEPVDADDFAALEIIEPADSTP